MKREVKNKLSHHPAPGHWDEVTGKKQVIFTKIVAHRVIFFSCPYCFAKGKLILVLCWKCIDEKKRMSVIGGQEPLLHVALSYRNFTFIMQKKRELLWKLISVAAMLFGTGRNIGGRFSQIWHSLLIFLFHFSFQIFGFQDEDSLIMTFGAKSGCATGSKLTPSGKNHSFGSQCLMTRSKYICCIVFNSHNNGKKL